MVEDITAKKTAEEARFRHVAVVESSEEAIISENLDAIITSWNLGAERIFGYAEAEVIGEPITILIPPELGGTTIRARVPFKSEPRRSRKTLMLV